MKKLFIVLLDEIETDFSGFSHCEAYLSDCIQMYGNSDTEEYALRLEVDRACFLQSQSQTKEETHQKVQWVDLSSWDGRIFGNITYSKSVPDTLHAIIEDLPKFGVQLELVWIRDAAWPELRSSLQLFGELKCLSCWYHARILLATGCSTEDRNISAWANVLTAETLSIEELRQNIHTNIPMWSGHVKLYPSESEDPVALPGFSLLPHISESPTLRWKLKDTQHTEEREDVFYQNHFDFLALVNIRDIPAFYITSSVYELCVKCEGSRTKKSKKFLKHLLENEQIGYIVRLTSSTSWKTKKKGQSIFRHTNTVTEEKSWIDAVIENASCLHDPSEDIELDGDIAYLHLLLCKSNSRKREDKVLAYRLRNPKEINSAACRQFVQLQTTASSGVEDQTLSSTESPGSLPAFLKSQNIPYYETQTWLEMEDRVTEAQWRVVQDWAEHKKKQNEDACLDVSELYYIFGETRRVYTERYKELHGDYCSEVPSTEPLQLRVPKPEHETLYNQLERMVLIYNNSLESKMARFKSSDSLAGLSPPGQVLKLNAEEFLKHFTKDGKPKKEKLSTLKVKKTRMNKFDSGELNKSEWPDCSHFKYHDIYYNVGTTPEKLEQKSVRLKTKLHYVETNSTCDPKQARSQQTLAMKDEIKPRKSRTSLRDSITPTKGRRTSGQMQRTPRGTRKRSLSSEEARAALHSSKKRKLQTPPKVSPECAVQTRVKCEKRRSNVSAKAEKSQEKQKPESRSQRHKRKLEAAVVSALEANGVTKSEDKVLFKSCFQRLYLLSYSFIKDLRDYSSLTEEMEKITTMQAPTVVHFERKQHTNK